MSAWVLFVQCCDSRFQVVAQSLRKHLGVTKGQYDPISIPGGAGNLEILRSSMEKLSPIRPKNRLAVLTIHEDCATGATLDDLRSAIVAAQSYFPQVDGYLLKLDGTFELIHSMKQDQLALAE